MLTLLVVPAYAVAMRCAVLMSRMIIQLFIGRPRTPGMVLRRCYALCTELAYGGLCDTVLTYGSVLSDVCYQARACYYEFSGTKIAYVTMDLMVLTSHTVLCDVWY